MKPIQKIPLQQINLSEETFSVNFMPDLAGLRSSIKEVGLIQPVLLRKRMDGYQILCGFRRITVLKELGEADVESRIFEENEVNPLRLFDISLHENLTSRGYNAVEKGIALDKLIHQFQVQLPRVIQTYLPFFSLEPNEKILNTYLSLARMEEEIKTYILKEGVSRSNIRKLAALSPEDRLALLPVLSSLKLGENRTREILTLLEEISHRDRLRIEEIIRQPEVKTILSQKELTPSQKTERIKKALLALRYPTLSQLEENFEEKRRGLNLPSGVALRHLPYFEAKGWRMEFQFETAEEYRSIVSSLSLLSGMKAFQGIFQGT